MSIDVRNINCVWASLMIEELVRSGVDTFCLAPGSRCTPLTLAVAGRDDVRVFQHTDERGLGYFAVGYARATGRAAVVITTSGTAVANLLPAVVEARMDRLPLIVLCGDRPPELRDIGANQTIDQVKIFGDHAVWFNDFPCPTTEIAPSFVLSTMNHAVYASRNGPVHVNCLFREPLAATEDGQDYEAYLKPLGSWSSDTKPYTTYALERPMVDAAQGDRFAELFDVEKKGVLVAGSGLSASDLAGIQSLASKMKWPLFVDVDCGGFKKHSLHHFDPLLRDEDFCAQYIPDVVIHFGGRLVSKSYETWLAKTPVEKVVLLVEHTDPFDPVLCITDRFTAQVRWMCQLVDSNRPSSKDAAWLHAWEAGSAQVAERFLEIKNLSEPALARTISRLMDMEHGLFLGNSMPVRDMDVFFHPEMVLHRVGINRGASGIDGTVAAAIGFAQGLKRPVTLVVGDLAAIHDINALILLKQMNYPVTVVVINNDGGGIFSHLPVVEDSGFEKYFGTPHGLGFEQAAAWAGVAYAAPASVAEFEKAYEAASKSADSCVIEVKADRNESLAMRRKLLS